MPANTLDRLLDGDLPPSEGLEVRARVAADPEWAARASDLELIGAALREVVQREAESVPQARFEQLMDAVERSVAAQAQGARGAAGEAGAAAAVSAWWARPWIGGLVVAGAAAIALLILRPWQDGIPPAGQPSAGEAHSREAGVNPPGEVASKAPDAARQPVELGPDEGAAPELALGPNHQDPALAMQPLTLPDSNDAEIERIEFGGASGRISQIEGVRGTTTVIWVEEDEDPLTSERAL